MNKKLGIFFALFFIVTGSVAQETQGTLSQIQSGISSLFGGGDATKSQISPQNEFINNVVNQTTTATAPLEKIPDLTQITADPKPAVLDTSWCDPYVNSPLPTVSVIGRFCVSTLRSLNGNNGIADNMNRNFNNSMFKIAKFFTYSMAIVGANMVYMINDVFANDHKKYITYFSDYSKHQQSIDSSINKELSAILDASKLSETDLTAIKQGLLADLEHNSSPIDVNQFSSTTSYNDTQLANAQLIKRLVEVMSLPPKLITLDSPVFLLKKYSDNGSPPYPPIRLPLSPKSKANLAATVKNIPEYINYNLSSNFNLISRAINLNALLRVFFARQAPDNLAQNEYDMATQGMSQDYYDKMAKQPLANINIEMLRSINKLVYFMYKLHNDNENLLLLQALNGLQLSQAGSSVLDEMQFDKAAKQVYKAYCNLPEYTNTEQCSTK